MLRKEFVIFNFLKRGKVDVKLTENQLRCPAFTKQGC